MLSITKKRFEEIRTARQLVREGTQITMDPDWIDDLMDVVEELAVERLVVMSENSELRRLLGLRASQ